jgi:hypothetical protein
MNLNEEEDSTSIEMANIISMYLKCNDIEDLHRLRASGFLEYEMNAQNG